jgi:hypothetical protein
LATLGADNTFPEHTHLLQVQKILYFSFGMIQRGYIAIRIAALCDADHPEQLPLAKYGQYSIGCNPSPGKKRPAKSHPPKRRSMSSSTTDPYDVTTGSRAVAPRDVDRRVARETKPSFKTTELIVYVLSVLGVLIASWVVDVNEDGQRFSAYQGWFLVTLLTIGYLISRGLAKSGSRDETR